MLLLNVAQGALAGQPPRGGPNLLHISGADQRDGEGEKERQSVAEGSQEDQDAFAHSNHSTSRDKT